MGRSRIGTAASMQIIAIENVITSMPSDSQKVSANNGLLSLYCTYGFFVLPSETKSCFENFCRIYKLHCLNNLVRINHLKIIHFTYDNNLLLPFNLNGF